MPCLEVELVAPNGNNKNRKRKTKNPFFSAMKRNKNNYSVMSFKNVL